LGLWVALSLVGTAVWSTAARATAANQRVDLKVLVVSDGSVTVEAMANQLSLDGTPFTKVAAGSNAVTASGFLQTSNTWGHYEAVVIGAPSSLTVAEKSALSAYETAFGVRQVNASIGWNQ